MQGMDPGQAVYTTDEVRAGGGRRAAAAAALAVAPPLTLSSS